MKYKHSQMKNYKLIDFLFEKDGLQNVRGEVTWLESHIHSPHIQKIINELALYTGIPASQIEDDIKDKFEKYPKPKSKVAEETMYKNALESILFDELQELTEQNKENPEKIIHKAPKFSIRVFQSLWNMIRAEHDDLFPLTSIINKKAIMPKYIILPSPSNPEWNGIKTAAIDANATVGFHLKFMQDLIDFAHMKGIQPKGKKYTNNGGEIPSEYGYIEFLILHEFMHYVYADNYYTAKLKAHPMLINLTGDFRTNQMLVKAGYEQIPIGMFSDHINYDKQKTYKEMYDLVKTEFSKSNEDNNNGDGEDGEEGEDGEGGEGGEGGDSQESKNKEVFEIGDVVTIDGIKKYKVKSVGEMGPDGDYDLELEEIINEDFNWRNSHRHLFESTITVKAKADGIKLVQQGGKPSKGNPGKGGNIKVPTWKDPSDDSDDSNDSKDSNKESNDNWEASDVNIPEHLQSHDSHDTPGAQWDYDSKDIEHGDFEEMNKRSDKKSKEIHNSLDKAKNNQVSTAKEALEKIKQKENEQAKKSMDQVTTGLQVIKSKINWIKLLDKLVKNVYGHVVDTSYQKISKRSISSITQAAQGMPGVIKPGEVLSPEGEQRKLVIVIDSSGSMIDKIGLIQSQIYTLVKKYSKGISDDFYLIKFSDNYNVYKCNISRDEYYTVDVSTIYTNKPYKVQDVKKGLANILKTSIGSGTSLSSSLVSACIQSTNKNNSILLFSDSDIFDGSNSSNLQNMLSHSKRNSIGIILKNSKDFEGFTTKYGNMYSGFVTCIN